MRARCRVAPQAHPADRAGAFSPMRLAEDFDRFNFFVDWVLLKLCFFFALLNASMRSFCSSSCCFLILCMKWARPQGGGASIGSITRVNALAHAISSLGATTSILVFPTMTYRLFLSRFLLGLQSFLFLNLLAYSLLLHASAGHEASPAAQTRTFPCHYTKAVKPTHAANRA